MKRIDSLTENQLKFEIVFDNQFRREEENEQLMKDKESRRN